MYLISFDKDVHTDVAVQLAKALEEALESDGVAIIPNNVKVWKVEGDIAIMAQQATSMVLGGKTIRLVSTVPVDDGEH